MFAAKDDGKSLAICFSIIKTITGNSYYAGASGTHTHTHTNRINSRTQFSEQILFIYRFTRYVFAHDVYVLVVTMAGSVGGDIVDRTRKSARVEKFRHLRCLIKLMLSTRHCVYTLSPANRMSVCRSFSLNDISVMVCDINSYLISSRRFSGLQRMRGHDWFEAMETSHVVWFLMSHGIATCKTGNRLSK